MALPDSARDRPPRGASAAALRQSRPSHAGARGRTRSAHRSSAQEWRSKVGFAPPVDPSRQGRPPNRWAGGRRRDGEAADAVGFDAGDPRALRRVRDRRAAGAAAALPDPAGRRSARRQRDISRIGELSVGVPHRDDRAGTMARVRAGRVAMIHDFGHATVISFVQPDDASARETAARQASEDAHRHSDPGIGSVTLDT